MFSITDSTLEINVILNCLSLPYPPINDKSSRSQWRQKDRTDTDGALLSSAFCALQSQTLSQIVITVQ